MMRKTSRPIDEMFTDRWSPRAFDTTPVPRETVLQVLEAARWAPSAMNEQPWRFVYALEPDDLRRFREALVEGNQVWANRAPVLLFVLARKRTIRNERNNGSRAFDAGAAWMSLALQARKLGLYTHAMGGFDHAKAYDATGADPEVYEVLAAVAMGTMGSADALPETLREREMPSDRKPVEESCFEGRM
jgi:nitroreductase